MFAAQGDLGEWVRDYGAFVAALAAVIVGVANGVFAIWGARQSKREEWERETRLPVYLSFARAVEELIAEATLHWENTFGGPGLEDRRTSQRELDDCHHDMNRCLADVELVGPSDAAHAARALMIEAAAHRWKMEGPAGAANRQALSSAFDAFREQARRATNLRT